MLTSFIFYGCCINMPSQKTMSFCIGQNHNNGITQRDYGHLYLRDSRCQISIFLLDIDSSLCILTVFITISRKVFIPDQPHILPLAVSNRVGDNIHSQYLLHMLFVNTICVSNNFNRYFCVFPVKKVIHVLIYVY